MAGWWTPLCWAIFAGRREWGRGEPCLAQIHLAHSGLCRLPDAEKASSCLLVGGQLLANGIAPRELIRACGLNPAPLDLLKAGYDPDQPRVPAGNSDGGQWTDGDADGSGYGSSDPPGGQPSSASGGDLPQPSTTLHGYATVYDRDLTGKPTSTGDAYDPNKMTAAVLPGTIPLKSVATVTLDSDPSRSVDVYVNDHGLYNMVTNPDGSRTPHPLPGRVIDLSRAAFHALTGTNIGNGDGEGEIGSPEMISTSCGGLPAMLALLLGTVCTTGQVNADEFPRYCLTIALDLHDREEVSGIDIVVQNATVVRVPRFPPGWEIKIENQIEGTTIISGSATGSVAELNRNELKCLFQIHNAVTGTPPITATGSVYISTGETEHRLFLHKSQIILEKIEAK